jgi:hypothetical protein
MLIRSIRCWLGAESFDQFRAIAQYTSRSDVAAHRRRGFLEVRLATLMLSEE